MKKRSYGVCLLVLAAFLVLGLAACGDGGEAPAAPAAPASPAEPGAAPPADPPAAGDDDWQIVLVPKDATNAWFVRMEEGVRLYNATHEGVSVRQEGPPATDAAMQAEIIRGLIAQGVDAIAVVPVDPAALESVLGEAMDAGIVVVSHEGSTMRNTMYNIEAFQNADYGAFIMDVLAEAMGEEGVYTTMVGHVTNASHNEWADGGVAHQAAAFPNMTLLASQPRVESEDNTEVAFNRAIELITMYPELRGIMGTSSKDAPGVARAIEELGLQGQFFVAGTGMPNEVRQFIENGTLTAATLWDPADAGYALVSLAHMVLQGIAIGDGTNLGLPGWENMQVDTANTVNTTLFGSGWIIIDRSNIDDFDF